MYKILLSLIMLGCENNHSSDVKTLDQLTNDSSASDAIYQCAATDDTRLGALRVGLNARIEIGDQNCSRGAPEAECAAVRNALAAVPTPVLQAFLAMEGNIWISPKAREFCTEVPKQMTNERRGMFAQMSQADLNKINGCWRTENKNGLGSFVIASPDTKTFGQNVTRHFGYVVSQVFPYTIKQTLTSSSATKYLIDFSPNPNSLGGAFFKAKLDFADQLLIDLKNNEKDPNAKYKLSNMQWLLGDKGLAALQNNSIAKLLDNKELEPVLQQKLTQFVDYAAADAFDSAKCADQNARSPEILAAFPKSIEASAVLVQAFEDNATYLFRDGQVRLTEATSTEHQTAFALAESEQAEFKFIFIGLFAKLLGGLFQGFQGGSYENSTYAASGGSYCPHCKSGSCSCANGSCGTGGCTGSGCSCSGGLCNCRSAT